MMLAEDVEGQTAWHLAVWCCYKEILVNLWVWARNLQLNLKDDQLLLKYFDGQSAWHIAAWHGYLKVL